MGLHKFFKNLLKLNKHQPRFYWENYNRARFVHDHIKKSLGEGAKVLDVGGVNAHNLLKDHGLLNVTTLNIYDADIIAGAQRMPCKDASFEVVTCIDTLEHIPLSDRKAVIGELLRVASKMVIIVAPVNSEENKRAERIVMKYLTSSFVREHQEHGLVDFSSVRQAIEEKGSGRIEGISAHDLDNLMSWLLMMIGSKVEPSDLYQEIYFLENGFFPKRKALCVKLH